MYYCNFGIFLYFNKCYIYMCVCVNTYYINNIITCLNWTLWVMDWQREEKEKRHWRTQIKDKKGSNIKGNNNRGREKSISDWWKEKDKVVRWHWNRCAFMNNVSSISIFMLWMLWSLTRRTKFRVLIGPINLYQFVYIVTILSLILSQDLDSSTTVYLFYQEST